MASKTILIGNGINYLGGSPISWSKLLEDLMQYNQFTFDELPYAMAYEKIRFDWQAHHGDEDSSRLKQEIAKKLENHPGNATCKKILELGFTNYITTNYDYAIENSFELLNNKNTFSNLERNDKQGEKYYSIRRKTELKTNQDTVGIVWHIHGEINPYNSIMLGFNHYVGSVAKVDSYLKGTYESDSNLNLPKIQNIENKIKNNSYDQISWIELFFNSDIHIVGFGLDFYEIDLWNILTKRARLKSKFKIDNKIYYYTKPLNQVKEKIRTTEKRKRQMLKNLSVEIIEKEIHDNNYIEQWEKFIDHMREN